MQEVSNLKTNKKKMELREAAEQVKTAQQRTAQMQPQLLKLE
jgi:hypothetical protein